ncbi:MAG: LysR family transcriptional regulator [Olsenella sp.]|jgi:DNA-binding transcriptional LysR family regulator|nr:LysR family transcriptional regulator [Olsenella sp.]MCI1288686.1 LysR family transcriptional regulator [Olsenella sp.]
MAAQSAHGMANPQVRQTRYSIFLEVVRQRSFTKVAKDIGYTQSAVSQTVKALERELGCTLVERGKDGVTLTKDGQQFMPYLQALARDEAALDEKRREVQGLGRATITIGTFTSVSRNLLPGPMLHFRQRYPDVRFVLRQSEYTSIAQWVRTGACDLGFTNLTDAQTAGLETHAFGPDRMMAVVPPDNPLAEKDELCLADLADQPLILLDEGRESVTLHAFEQAGVEPNVCYEVTDDYSILAMVRQGLGVTVLYEMMLMGFESGVAVRPIREEPKRTITLGWRSSKTLPLAARRFSEYIIRELG